MSPRPQPPRRALIVGDYLGRNFGHDGLLYVIISALARQNVRAVVPTLAPRQLARALGTVPADILNVGWPTWSVRYFGRPAWRAVRDVDLVLVTDNVLYDLHLPNPLANPLLTLPSLLRHAARLRVPTAYLCGGFGPVRSALGRWLVRRTDAQFVVRTARDQETATAMAAAGLPPPGIVAADAAYLPVHEPTVRSDDGRGIGVVLSRHVGGGRSSDQAALARALATAADQTAKRVTVFVAHVRDWAASSTLLRRLPPDLIQDVVVQGETSIPTFFEHVDGLGGAISDRYHEITLLTARGVPCIGLGTGSKLSALYRALNTPDLLVDRPSQGLAETIALGTRSGDRVREAVRTLNGRALQALNAVLQSLEHAPDPCLTPSS